jgi:predicted RNA polymerase sigma factor
MSAAKNRAIDRLRHESCMRARRQIAQEIEAPPAEIRGTPTPPSDKVGDDLLRLIFIACHPVLPADRGSHSRSD